MPAIVCNASFSTTSPRKPNSIQSASILTNFLSGVLNSQPNCKLRNSGDLKEAEYLFVAGFQFREEFLLQLKCDLLAGGRDRAYSFRNARNREDAAQRLPITIKVRALGSIL
jgi:hypothetical protein